MGSIIFLSVDGEAFGDFEADIIIIGSNFFFLRCNNVSHFADVSPSNKIDMNHYSINKQHKCDRKQNNKINFTCCIGYICCPFDMF